MERTKKLKVGDGMQPGIDIGPCVDEGQMETVLRVHRDRPQGSAASRRAAASGSRMAALAKGYFVEPTVFADVTEEHTIAQEEIFGPVLADHAREGFRRRHADRQHIPFGLSSSIQTTNLSRAFDYIYRAEAGLLTVNLPSAGVEYQLPFGGTKDSSFGPKEQGPAALEFYSDYKTST